MTTPDAPLTPAPTPATVPPATVPPAPPAAPAAAATPLQPVVVATRASGGRWVNLLLGAAAVVAIGGVAFAVGRSTAPADAFAAFPDRGVIIDGGATGSFDPGQGFPGGGGPAGGPGFLGAGGPTLEGTVTSVDADSITIQLASGDEMTLALDDETTYHESTAADPGTVQVGDEVAVQADGGRITIGGDGGETGQGSDKLTANDVTVRR